MTVQRGQGTSYRYDASRGEYVATIGDGNTGLADVNAPPSARYSKQMHELNAQLLQLTGIAPDDQVSAGGRRVEQMPNDDDDAVRREIAESARSRGTILRRLIAEQNAKLGLAGQNTPPAPDAEIHHPEPPPAA